jgi:hypothetical protein
MMRNLIEQIKKTIVFIGRVNKDKKPQFYATGALILIQKIFHLITAKHVIYDLKSKSFKDDAALVFLNSKDRNIMPCPINEVKNKYKVNWIFHPDEKVDIAIIPFGLSSTADVKTIPEDLFLTIDRLFELYDIFFLSYQPGIEPQGKISPVIRSGSISLISDDKTFYIDGAAFPGNSGSPVFLKPSPIRFDEQEISIGGDKLGGKFIGIIGEYIPYREVAISVQTQRPRVVFEENTGLSKVWSVAFIKEIIESEIFKEQLARVLEKNIK